MKYKYMPMVCIMLLFLSFLLSESTMISVMATNFMSETSYSTGFSMEEISEERQKAFISNVNISMLEEEPTNKAIVCFDVNEDGLIALGFSASNSKTIAIYTINGVFQYGYSFHANGSFGLEWAGDNINIYFVRSDIAARITPKGEFVEVLKIKNTIENDEYWRHSVFAIKRTVGDCEYFIRNEMGPLNIFTASYSQLVEVDKAGTTSVIYDVNSAQLLKYIVIIIAILLFIAIVVSAVVIKLVKLRR